MLSQTRRALEDFDNQHDFERMSADILNALGYTAVEPLAPGGGPDGGQDIRFREGDTPGIAFVTLDKRILEKFKSDLAKQLDNEGVIALFCNVNSTPKMKLDFAKLAIEKGYRIEVFDLERLRSLLDSSLKDVRRRYLQIDDDVAVRLRSEVNKLLRFPAAVPNTVISSTLVENLLLNKIPLRLFDLLIRYEEKDIRALPKIGRELHEFMVVYYQFRQFIKQFEEQLISKISHMVDVRVRDAWVIYLEYVVLRFSGCSEETLSGGEDFLNYGITWNDAERVFSDLSMDASVSSSLAYVSSTHLKLVQRMDLFTT